MAPDTGFFSPDYPTARDRFRRQAEAAGARRWSLPLDARGPEDGELSVDLAWLGPASASRVLVVQSGVHGVEAFAGAAVQLDLLGRPPLMQADTALLLVHVVNPYGTAWLRRVNEHNVDLNRNCLAAGDSYAGAPPGYHALDPLLNPRSAPAFDFFTLRAGWQVLRQGLGVLKEAVAAGQYEYPRGLFYGGARLEQGPLALRDWLGSIEGPVAELVVLDLHSGLGRYGQASVFTEPGADRGRQRLPRGLFGAMPAVPGAQGPAYRIRGGMANLYRQVFPGTEHCYLTVEFGTYSMLRVLHALREENRCHYFGDGVPGHPARAALREALSPADERWRHSVLQQGRRLAELAAGDWRASGSGDRV